MRIGLDIPHELDYELERPRPREEEQSEVSLQPERNPVQEHLPALRERAAEHRLNHEPPRGPRSLQQKHDIDAPSRQRNKDPREQTDERRTRRDHLPRRAIGLPLRSEERKVMLELGRFRVAQVPHLAEAIYDGRQRRLNDDLNYLRSKGLVETRNINMRRGGVRREVERVEVASLTREGRAWLTHSGDVPQDQKVYYGFVKPREIEHDSLIYRACRDASRRIEQNGGSNLRIKLDFELKAE
ncbi:MAG: hypothetical protein FWD64_07760, partial [Acidobacteriaceae bacterium]|nr:hypothetical protein [Acidobacteriaceae bacterium]